MATFEGPVMSIRAINAPGHYTDRTIGHVHSGALRWNGFITFGAFYRLFPKLWGKKAPCSTKPVSWHSRVATLGIVLCITAMWVSGIMQGLMWRACDELGFLQHSIIETVAAMHPCYAIRGAAGLTGRIAREAVTEEVQAQQARLEPMPARLREATPDQVAADPGPRASAMAGGRIAFANNRAGCHGAGGQGAPGGFPSPADDDWLWGGSYEAVHRTIRHGIRAAGSEEVRASQMPRFLADGVLTAAQVNDVAGHVLSLTGRAGDGAAAGHGAALYADNCAGCHGERGEGNRDLGAPRLSDRSRLHGGDKASVARSIAFARGGVMPAWGGRLGPAVVTMLAVYVHQPGGGE